jgi:hypothetical protein
LEIRAIWRSGKGKQFADVSKLVFEPEPSSIGRSTSLEFRECQGKAVAIQAARELLARHAHRFDDRTEIETRIYPEIEWSEPMAKESLPT